MSLPTPNTRKEQYLNAIATGNAGGLPTPITREEEYLDAIAKGGGSGDGDMKKSVYDSDLDVAGAGGIKAFVSNAISNKVDKVEGKGLSTNDYTNEDKAIVDSVTGALAEKADTDDIPDLVSDNLAKGILGNETVLSTDNTPFLSKIMGTGKYQRKKFVGCSYVWNQQIVADAKSASYTWNTSTGTYNRTIYSFASEKTIPLYVGHKYLISIYGERTISNNNYFRLFLEHSNGAILIGTWDNGAPNGIVKAIISPESAITITGIRCNNYAGKQGYDAGDTVSFDNLFIVDLTQLFGSTAIADAIYNLEQATAGAGIAKLKELGFFTEDYYAYDAGSIQSVDIKEYSVTGFNLWDEQWEVSNVPFSGANLQSKNIIKVFPNATYFIQNSTVNIGSRGVNIAYYDSNDNVISTDRIYTTSVTIPNNCYGIKFGFATNYYGTTYNNDICINLSDPARNGQYEPYHKSTYSLTPTELRGVPKIDANNNIYCDGDEYASDGGHTEKYDICDLGELDWSLATNVQGGTFFYSDTINNLIKSNGNTICPKYLNTHRQHNQLANEDKTMSTNGQYFNKGIFVKDITYENEENPAVAFKTAMSGVYLVYEKDTPTTETLTPFDYPQSVGSLEEITDYKVEQEDRDVAIPTGHVTEYMGKGGEFTLPTLPTTPSVLAFDGHNFFWKPETA